MAVRGYNPMVAILCVQCCNLDWLQDRLMGHNVKVSDYQNGEEIGRIEDERAELERLQYEEFEGVEVPFVVLRWFHGCIEEREWPEWQVVSCHRTQRGAELEMVALELWGQNPDDLRIETDYPVPQYMFKYHPMQD